MRIGLIAGNGRFPFLVIDAARNLGHQVTVVAIREEADAALESIAGDRSGISIHPDCAKWQRRNFGLDDDDQILGQSN